MEPPVEGNTVTIYYRVWDEGMRRRKKIVSLDNEIFDDKSTLLFEAENLVFPTSSAGIGYEMEAADSDLPEPEIHELGGVKKRSVRITWSGEDEEERGLIPHWPLFRRQVQTINISAACRAVCVGCIRTTNDMVSRDLLNPSEVRFDNGPDRLLKSIAPRVFPEHSFSDHVVAFDGFNFILFTDFDYKSMELNVYWNSPNQLTRSLSGEWNAFLEEGVELWVLPVDQD